VPLSEREQRILEEIEKDLYKEDPTFARAVRTRTPRMDELRRVRWGALLFILGLGILMAFFVTQSLVVGVAAFVAMVGGIVMIAGALRGLASAGDADGPNRRQRMSRALGDWEERIRQRYKRS
jgi:hypothetical protein